MLIVQAIFSGLYTTSFFHCFRWLVFADEGWERRKKIHWSMLIIAILIFALALINFGIIVKWELSFLRGATTEFYLVPAEALLLVCLNSLFFFECN